MDICAAVNTNIANWTAQQGERNMTKGGQWGSVGEYNEETTHSHHHDFVGEAMSVPVLVVLGSLHALSILNGVLGNTLLLVALFTDKPFRILSNTYSVYLVNLVLVDLYLLAYYFPMMLAGFILGRYPAVNHTHCVVTAYLSTVSYQTTLLTLLLVSADRYVRVRHNHFYKKHCSRKSSAIACVFTWVLGSVVALPMWLDGTFGFNPKLHTCQSAEDKGPTYGLLAFVVVGLLTVVGYGTLNFRLYRVICAFKRRNAQVPVSAREDVALLRSIFVIFVCLLVCLVTNAVVRLVAVFVEIPVEVYGVCVVIMSVNSSVSWMVFCVTNARFRYGYKRALSKMCRRL
ncbi:hypothetical protein BaRGS_00012079 [Batillaria attramentaria]|uniref:G-protein coupled receptors family 1 profile domain-containing protein n=1 Tax=Batillaria attramentaria TaxID=370345 RepID=A0ABD0LBC4_9CAEN